MNPTRSDLWLLLQLMDGTIPSADRESLRARIAEEKVLRQRWQQLNSVQPSANETDTGTEPVSPDDIAAFLDGTLSKSDEQAFETMCWQSPEALFELVSLASNGHADVLASDGLTDRLLALNASVQEADHGVLPTIEIRTSQPERNPPSSSKYVVPALLSVIAVLLAAVLWLSLRDGNDPNQIAEDDKQSAPIEKPEPDRSPDPQSVENQNPPRDDDRDATPQPVVPPTMDEGPKVVDSPPVEVPRTPDPSVPPDMKPRVPDPKPDIPKVAASPWTTRGVVGARPSARLPWAGLNAVDLPIDANFMTLPTSRAVTESATGIEFVIADQSEIVGLAWGEVSEVRLIRGQAAFRRLRKGDVVRFLFERWNWEAKANRDDTSIALSLSGFEPRLTVISGAAKVGRTTVDSNEWLAFNKPQRQRVSNVSDFAWVDAWSDSNFTGDRLARLMNSQDLRADVLSESGGRLVSMMVAPETTVFQMLNSASPEQRNAGLWWLINNPDTGAGSPGNTAWATIRRATRNSANRNNQTSVADSMKAWLDGLRQNAPVTKRTLGQMARALDVNPRAVRFVAISCLRHYAGANALRYDVDWNKQQRQKAVQDWSRLIRSLP